MAFTPDTEAALQAAVELVNSAEEPDTLTTEAELDAFVTGWGYTGRRDPGPVELAAVRALRGSLRELLTSDRDDAVRIVNRTLARHRAVPRLVRHDGSDYHVHAIDDDAPFADRVAVETAMAVSELVLADEMSRLSVCAERSCDGLVIDLSRNRSRRFCSTTCGNRAAAAAYRARKA